MKAMIERILKECFIQTIKYVEWISNILHIMRNNGQVCVRMDYNDLNLPTPKDKYKTPLTC